LLPVTVSQIKRVFKIFWTDKLQLV